MTRARSAAPGSPTPTTAYRRSPRTAAVRLVGDVAGRHEPGGLMTERTTRAERLALPLATSAIKALTEAKGGCIRPVQLRRTNIDTGQVEQVLVPCGATLASA